MSDATLVTAAPSKSDKNLKKTSRTQTVQLLPLIVKSATTAGLLFAVWGAGWYHYSVSWVIGASAAYFAGKQYKKSLKEEKKRREEEQELEEPTLARVDELPTWVYFPDVERAEWLNKMIQQMWPYIGEHVSKTIRSMESGIEVKLPTLLHPFKFEEITLGDIPPRIGGVKVYIDNVKRDEIVMDAEITYAGDADINVSLRGIHAGIKDILLHGMVRIIFRPLINKIPLIGGLEFCFISPPNLDFDFTNFANILDVPFLNDSLRKVITDQLSNIIVLPNVLRFELASADLLAPKASGLSGVTVGGVGGITLPYGVLRIKMVEADDLKRADAGKIFGQGKSDPYSIVSVGGSTYKTKYIENTLSPRWDEVFEFVVDDVKTQEIEIKVYDHDDHANDDFIGNCYVRMEDVVNGGHMDEWLRLSNVKTGRVHVVCDIFYLTADVADPARVKSSTGSTCLLMVGVESAKDLPMRISKSHSKGLVEPSPCVALQLGSKKVKTTTKVRTINPKWEEMYHFMVSQPDNESLFAQVIDTSKNDNCLGKVSYKIDKILTDEDMMLHQPFVLENNSSESILTLKMCLRFLTTTPPQIDPSTNHSQNETDITPGGISPIEPEFTDNLGNSRPPGVPGSAGVKKENETESKPRYRGNKIMGDSKLGKIQLTLRYNQEKEKVILIVHKCINLIAHDKDNFSDPYVRMYLLPDRTNQSKRKTNIMKNNLNPVWDESFEWPVKKADLPNRTLEIMVKNFIGVFEKKTQTEMGVVSLRLVDFDNLGQPVSDWFDLQDPSSLLGTSSSIF